MFGGFVRFVIDVAFGLFEQESGENGDEQGEGNEQGDLPDGCALACCLFWGRSGDLCEIIGVFGVFFIGKGGRFWNVAERVAAEYVTIGFTAEIEITVIGAGNF